MARRGGLVVVVEVRSRRLGGYESALGSVSVVKRRRLLNATDRLWRRRFAGDMTVERTRIDVAGVSFEGGETRVEYVEGAIVGGD